MLGTIIWTAANCVLPIVLQILLGYFLKRIGFFSPDEFDDLLAVYKEWNGIAVIDNLTGRLSHLFRGRIHNHKGGLGSRNLLRNFLFIPGKHNAAHDADRKADCTCDCGYFFQHPSFHGFCPFRIIWLPKFCKIRPRKIHIRCTFIISKQKPRKQSALCLKDGFLIWKL